MTTPAKILIVDDDLDLVAMLQLVLERGGYTVTTANDAARGLRKVESERPDLIVLDVMMPDGDEGFQMVAKLRQESEPYFAAVPIIMLTAIHQRTDLRFYPGHGVGTQQAAGYLQVQEFLDKPIDPARLVERVKRELGKAKKT
jgi:CheY-like chemotaxis protein